MQGKISLKTFTSSKCSTPERVPFSSFKYMMKAGRVFTSCIEVRERLANSITLVCKKAQEKAEKKNEKTLWFEIYSHL